MARRQAIAALMSLLMHMSALIEVVPEMTELEHNPPHVLPPGQGAIVLDARLRLQPIHHSR